MRRARREGRSLPSGPPGGARLSYRFTREEGALALERYLVTDDGETPLRSTLTALASGRVEGPPVVATQVDIAAERLARFFGASVELMSVLARAAGHRHLSEFTIDDLTTFKADMAQGVEAKAESLGRKLAADFG